MLIDYIEEMPRSRRQKISKAKTPKKANHKHVFEPCVLEYTNPRGRFDQEKGMVPSRGSRIDGYCPICGKIGPIDIGRWYQLPTLEAYKWGGKTKLSEEALRELDPATRTLPTFDVGDDWIFPEFVALPE